MGNPVTLLKDEPALFTSLHQSISDAVFMDIYLKTFKGIEMLTFLRKCDACHTFPVVIVSGIYPKQIVKNLLMCGASYLLKKSPAGEYAQVIERILQIAIRRPLLPN